MFTLLLSLLALLGAPLLDRLLAGRPGVCAALDAAGKVLVGGIVLVQVLPYGYATLGWPALVALIAGALLPMGCGRLPGGEGVVGVAAALALVSHGLLDGTMLADADGHGAGHGLAQAVVLHSLPVGLMLWRGLQPTFGARLAWVALLVSAGCEVAGWAAGEALLTRLGPAVGLVQCLAAGSLLHVLGHVGGGPARAEGVGALIGLAGVAAMAVTHPIPQRFGGELGLGMALLTLSVEVAPTLAVATAGAAALYARGWRWASRPLLLAGLSLPLLGGAFAAALLGFSALVAGVASRGRREAPSPPREALAVLVDQHAPWVVGGLVLGALVEPAVAAGGLDGLAGLGGVALAAAFGAPLGLAAVAAVPLLAVAAHKGLPLPAVWTLLSAGALLGVGPPGRVGWPGRVGVAALAALLGAALTAWPLLGAPPPLHGLSLHAHSLLEHACAVGLFGLYVASLLRQGLTDFLDPLLHPGGVPAPDSAVARVTVHAHEHAHDHTHAHEHMHEHTHDHVHGEI